MKYFTIEYAPSGHAKGDVFYYPDMKDHIVNVVRRSGTFYEADLLEHLRRFGPRKAVFVDVGANIGNHTLFFAKYLASRVVAIEPHPGHFDRLNAVIGKNGLMNVTTIRTATGSEKATATLSLDSRFEGNAGAYSIRADSASGNSVEVTVDTLDAILLRHVEDPRDIALVKIDVEGYEEEVLDGAQCIVRNHRPDLVVEIHSNAQCKRIGRDLSRLGYRVLGRFCASPTYHFACAEVAR